jgi:hypothetical protein
VGRFNHCPCAEPESNANSKTNSHSLRIFRHSTRILADMVIIVYQRGTDETAALQEPM